MKNFKFLALSVLTTVLLTGCGSEKTLTCSKTEDSSAGISVEQKIAMTFKNDKISNVEMSVNSKATSDTIKTYWDTFASTLDAQYPSKDENGITVSTKNNEEDYEYTITMGFDLSKASDDDLAEYGLDGIADSNSKLKDVKESAEEDGYTCK